MSEKKDNSEEIQRYKGLIVEMLKKVPSSVNNGSFQTAVAYKNAVRKANQSMDMKRPTLSKIHESYQSLAKFY